MIITRTYTETAKLSKPGHYAWTKFLNFQNVLYNGALQERSDCNRLTGRSISEYGQYKSLTTIRADDPNLAKYRAQVSRSALRRINRAFNNFYRRCEEKAKKLGVQYRPRYAGRPSVTTYLKRPICSHHNLYRITNPPRTWQGIRKRGENSKILWFV